MRRERDNKEKVIRNKEAQTRKKELEAGVKTRDRKDNSWKKTQEQQMEKVGRKKINATKVKQQE